MPKKHCCINKLSINGWDTSKVKNVVKGFIMYFGCSVCGKEFTVRTLDFTFNEDGKKYATK